MKPAYFEYHKAKTVEEAISLLESFGEDAKILAGGQSLIPLMSLRMARPAQVIDVKGIGGLSGVRESDGWLRIGALTKHYEVETLRDIRAACPVLAEAAKYVGHPQIRHRGTVGGSLCHADPAAQFPTVVAALDGTVIARGPNGSEREIAAEDFFLGYLTTSLAENEMVTELRVPKLPQGAGWSFQQVTDVDGAVPIACVAAILQLDAGGSCREARIAVGGVGATPIRAKKAEQSLQGKPVDEESIVAAAELIAGEIEPETDIRFTADYKTAVANTLVKRALREALERK